MAALAVTNAFVAGTNIVASQMNANFTDVVDWATVSPTLSTSGQTTTVSGKLIVTEEIWSSDDIFLNGAQQRIVWEGSSADANETYLGVINPTAARTISLPDATGTVALTSDITSPTWNSADNILTNSVFN